MVILMSRQQVRHGNDNGGEQMGWSKWGQEEPTQMPTIPEDRHRQQEIHSRQGIARLPIQSSDPRIFNTSNTLEA